MRAHCLRIGAQADPTYRAINSQKLVAALEATSEMLMRSLAIVEGLEEKQPAAALLPASHTIARSMPGPVACDIHLGVLTAPRRDFEASAAQISVWIACWISKGFAALKTMIARHGGPHNLGDTRGLVDRKPGADAR